MEAQAWVQSSETLRASLDAGTARYRSRPWLSTNDRIRTELGGVLLRLHDANRALRDVAGSATGTLGEVEQALGGRAQEMGLSRHRADVRRRRPSQSAERCRKRPRSRAAGLRSSAPVYPPCDAARRAHAGGLLDGITAGPQTGSARIPPDPARRPTREPTTQGAEAAAKAVSTAQLGRGSEQSARRRFRCATAHASRDGRSGRHSWSEYRAGQNAPYRGG